jgi:hypothetical protein
MPAVFFDFQDQTRQIQGEIQHQQSLIHHQGILRIQSATTTQVFKEILPMSQAGRSVEKGEGTFATRQATRPQTIFISKVKDVAAYS